ncbi:MAG: CHAT domain-containing protein [Anaerolineae bacterium]|nr:CHAT domain-containing protein [Anaerolineae bacterium]
MTLEQRARVPFFDDFAVQAQIRIQPAGKEYVAYIQTRGTWHRVRLGLQAHDAEKLRTELQQAVAGVSACFDDATGATDRAACARALSHLAHKGHAVLQGLSGEGVFREVIGALPPEAVVQATSEEFFMPWDLLYDGPLGDQADISGFWGMRYIISRALVQPQRPGDLLSPLISSTRPRLGLVASDRLPQVVTREIPALNRLRRQKRIFLSSLEPLAGERREQGLDQLARLWSRNLQIVHLACEVSECGPSGPSLCVAEDLALSAEDFRAGGFDLKHHPFVVLNVRLGGAANPQWAFHWAAAFWERGARGVLTPEFPMPDGFAAAFAETFYGHLLSGEPVGKALLASRHELWAEQGNPLALGYALYSSPSIRITQ